MTSHASAVAARLHDAAARIPVDQDLAAVLAEAGPGAAPGDGPGVGPGLSTTTVVRLPRRRRRAVLAGVAVALAAAATLTAVRAVARHADPAEVVPADATGAVAPHVVDPPDWFGEPRGGPGDSTVLRTGRWVSGAIARPAEDGMTDPVMVSVFVGGYRPLAQAEDVTIDGTPLRSAELDGWPGWTALATTGEPTVTVSGNVDEATLAAVIDAVEVTDPAGDFSLRLHALPAGYVEVVPPRVQVADTGDRFALASASGDTAVYAMSDWADPELAAASSGADVTTVDIDGTTAWTGRITANPAGPVRFLAWSPRDGVVFEITTVDPDRTVDDLADLARATTPIDTREWERRYEG